MPYVTHIPIHTGTHLKNSLGYINNLNKTERISAINCFDDIDASVSLFSLYDDINNKIVDSTKKPVIGHHYVQSFEPGSVSQDEAHDIGVELTKTIAPGYMCHVATHTDKNHIHNHIFIYAVNPETEYKYKHDWDQYKFVQEQSDAICLEKNIPIIENPKRRNIDNKEYRAIERGGSWKDMLAWDIDDAIKTAVKDSSGKEGFIDYFKSKGCEVNWQNKNISIKSSEHKAVRVDTLAKAFGERYTKENIKRRLKGEEIIKRAYEREKGDDLPKHLKYGDTERFNEYDRYVNWCLNRGKEIKIEGVKRDPPDLYFYKHRTPEATFAKFAKVDTKGKKREGEREGGKTRTWKDKLTEDIDKAIENAAESKTGKEGFIDYLKAQGYIVKYQNKNISINIPGRKAIRVDTLAKTHGMEYIKENIERRLKGEIIADVVKDFYNIEEKEKTKSVEDVSKYYKKAKSTRYGRFNLLGNTRATTDKNKYHKTKDEYELEKEMEEFGRTLKHILRKREKER